MLLLFTLTLARPTKLFKFALYEFWRRLYVNRLGNLSIQPMCQRAGGCLVMFSVWYLAILWRQEGWKWAKNSQDNNDESEKQNSTQKPSKWTFLWMKFLSMHELTSSIAGASYMTVKPLAFEIWTFYDDVLWSIGSKLTVVRLSWTTKVTIGQPNCAELLPLGHLNLPYLALVPNKHLIKLNKYNTLTIPKS